MLIKSQLYRELELIPFNSKDKVNKINFCFNLSVRLNLHPNEVTIRYCISGDFNNVNLLNSEINPCKMNRLWENTCFEVFFKNSNNEEYLEFNFSPKLEWNCFKFNGYRNKIDNYNQKITPVLQVEKNSDIYILEVCIDRSSIGFNDFVIGASAVISENGELSYWAVKHTSNVPDFHKFESFIEI